MKISTKLAFLFFVLVGSCALASEPSLCVGHPVSISKKILDCLKHHPVNQAINSSFKRIVERREDCATCSEEFSNEKKFSFLFGLSFLTLKMEQNSFGGYFSYIMFRESPERIYRLWVYGVDTNTLRVRAIKAIKPDAKDARVLVTLKTSVYSRFWF